MERERKILIVDDTAFMLAVISAALKSVNYEVITASSGEEAMELLKNTKPDLILLDGVMTGMSGYDVLSLLRQDFRFNLTPIIMLTGQTEEEEKLLGLEMGADDYIVKPFNSRELLARVNNTLIRLERNRGATPITGLRGNNEIETEPSRRLASNKPFSVSSSDLNSFKPYNDIYGFGNGDIAIKMTADIISTAVVSLGTSDTFIGHVGGDDFVVITQPQNAVPMSEEIIGTFDQEVLSLYTQEDRDRGYITAKDRYGKLTTFPILGISIAIVNSDQHSITSTLHLAEIAAELKKKAKNIENGKSAYVS